MVPLVSIGIPWLIYWLITTIHHHPFATNGLPGSQLVSTNRGLLQHKNTDTDCLADDESRETRPVPTNHPAVQFASDRET